MPLDPPRDLPPRYDVKGGSPRTPTRGIPVAEYQAQMQLPPMNGKGLWQMLTTGSAGLLIGFIVAWWTALQGRGVTQKEMQDYVDRFSQSKDLIVAAQQSTQDVQIGESKGKIDRIGQQINDVQLKLRDHERDFGELKTKLDIVADMLEQQKAKK